MAAPNNSNTILTVVEVGSPKVLKISSNIISANITARKMIITSWKLNIWGLKIPFLATSIMPPANKAPIRMPKLAMIIIFFREATLDPIAEFRKLTASLLTPTTKSAKARTINKITNII
jgi:hypothetical protein